MKKKILFIILTFLFMSNVKAAGEAVAKVGNTTYDTISEAVEAAKGSPNHELILQKDVEASTGVSFEVASGETVIVNLNGHKLHSTAILVLSVKNYGNLTIKNGTLDYQYGNMHNYAGGTLTYDKVNYIINNSSGKFVNEGINNIVNSTFSSNIDLNVIENEASGKVSIDNSTFNVGNIFVNRGDLTINSGNFKMNSNLYDENYGNLTINGGTFEWTIGGSKMLLKGSSNTTINGGTFTFASDGFKFYETTGATLTINNGTFKADQEGITDLSISPNTATFIMNGGTFEASGNNNFKIAYDFRNINTYINNGTLKSMGNESVIYIDQLKFVLGKNDGNVSSSPVINIPKGYIVPSNDNKSKIEFYDGKIISLSSNLLSYNKKGVSVSIPNGYSIKYDKNNDNSYTAYLVNGKISSTTGSNVKEDGKANVETKVENPKTGNPIQYGIVGTLLLIISGLFVYTKKYNKFPNMK